MNKNLLITNQKSKLLLTKTKDLLNITNKLLSNLDINTLVENFRFKPFLLERGHSDSINSIAITPDGKYIVSGSWDDTIKIWDIKTKECIYKLDNKYKIVINNNGYFNASKENIEKYLRVSESPLSQRKLTDEEIQHFSKKDNFLEIGNI